MYFCRSAALYLHLLLTLKCHASGDIASRQFAKKEITGGALTLTGYTSRQPVPRKMQCAEQCSQNDACPEFYYTSDENLCLLYDATAPTGNVHTVQTSLTVQYQAENFVLSGCPVNNGDWAKSILEDGSEYLFRLFTSTDVDHTEAVDNCKSIDIDSHPLRILTIEKMDFVQNTLLQCADVSGHSYWIDGTNADAADFAARDSYRTTDNQVVPYDGGEFCHEPDGPNDGRYPSCIWIPSFFKYKFDDVPCIYPGVKNICEKQLV